MISNLFILNQTGEVIIEKKFREKMPRNNVEDFWTTYMSSLNSLKEARSVIKYSRYAFVNIVRDGVMFLGITTHDTPPLLIMDILSMISSTLVTYLKNVTEQTLKENFSIVYQILEELIHNGYPLTTEYHVLGELVPRPTLESKMRSFLDRPKANNTMNRHALSSADHSAMAVSWRGPNVKYSNNEFYLDVIEYLDVVMDAEGGLVKASLRGSMECVCHLSGMPTVNVAIQKTELFEDIAFHIGVRHKLYDSNRTVSLVPPDGPFQLLRYQCKPIPGLQPPFYVNPQITFCSKTKKGRINCMVGMKPLTAMAKSNAVPLKAGKVISKVVVHMPLPPQAEGINVISCSFGSYTFNTKTKVVTWNVGNLDAVKSPSFSAEIILSDVTSRETLNRGSQNNDSNDTDKENENKKKKKKKAVEEDQLFVDPIPDDFYGGRGDDGHTLLESATIASLEGKGDPVTVEFSIAAHCMSGILISGINVLGGGNDKPFKGVKYTTKNGRFTVRTV